MRVALLVPEETGGAPLPQGVEHGDVALCQHGEAVESRRLGATPATPLPLPRLGLGLGLCHGLCGAEAAGLVHRTRE